MTTKKYSTHLQGFATGGVYRRGEGVQVKEPGGRNERGVVVRVDRGYVIVKFPDGGEEPIMPRDIKPE